MKKTKNNTWKIPQKLGFLLFFRSRKRNTTGIFQVSYRTYKAGIFKKIISEIDLFAKEKFEIKVSKRVILKILFLGPKMLYQLGITTVSRAHQEIPSV